MTKDFLAGLTVKRHRLILESSSINSVGLNNGTSGNLLPAPKLGSWTGHFTETSRGHSNYFFHYNQSYFIQACVPLPFAIAIGNLQFNTTLHSVTCINCPFCVTPVHFNHSDYNWEQIKFHLQNIHDNASLNVQLLQKTIIETFSKRLPSSTNLETLAKQLADQLSGLDP